MKHLLHNAVSLVQFFLECSWCWSRDVYQSSNFADIKVRNHQRCDQGQAANNVLDRISWTNVSETIHHHCIVKVKRVVSNIFELKILWIRIVHGIYWWIPLQRYISRFVSIKIRPFFVREFILLCDPAPKATYCMKVNEKIKYNFRNTDNTFYLFWKI